MIKVEYSKAISGLKKLEDIDLTNAMELIGITVENNAKLHIPVDTGTLRRSITHQIINNTTVEIGTNLEYAPYVELGTGIHALNGNGRQTPWKYKDAKGEWHTTEGQPPKLYMKQGLADSEADIVAIINKEIGRQLGDA